MARSGAPTETKPFATKALAEAWACQAEPDLEAGRAVLVSPSSTTTVGDLIKRFAEQVSKAKPFAKNKAWVLNRMAGRGAAAGNSWTDFTSFALAGLGGTGHCQHDFAER